MIVWRMKRIYHRIIIIRTVHDTVSSLPTDCHIKDPVIHIGVKQRLDKKFYTTAHDAKLDDWIICRCKGKGFL